MCARALLTVRGARASFVPEVSIGAQAKGQPFSFLRAEAGDDARSNVGALVARARSGDRQAFGELHRLFSKMVHGVLIAHVPPHDAHDLVQDVFLSAMQRLDSLREDAAFGGWLLSMTRTRALSHLRSRKDTEPLDESMPAPDMPSPDTARVLKAIRALPEAYRETLAMRLVEGMTGPEIALRTGLTEGSVRVNLHRGMKQLKEALGMGSGEGEDG